MYAARCWVLHPEGEVVSTGPQDLAHLDRRTVVKLSAISLAAAALGCAAGSWLAACSMLADEA